MSALRRSLLAAAFFVLFAFAQSDTATITGIITDSSDAAVPGAAVEAVNRATGSRFQAVTNEVGAYTLTALQVAVYDLTVKKEGFQSVQRTEIALHAGDRARIDFPLRLGAVSEVIEVGARAPLLDAETSSLAQVVENTNIVNMPLNGRNYQQLAMLSPGVLPSRTRNFVSDAFAVNGANMWQNQWVMDGADNTNYTSGVVIASNQVMKPSIDAIQEFKTETHNFSAEFGRGGGAVIQVTTKSGTNQIHGTLFEFVRNDKFDANNFFNSGRPKPPYRQNQYGGTLGGPIRQDRTFFFASYQGTRIREKLTKLSALPTPEMKNGDFGSTAIFDPATQNAQGVRQQFPNNRIPAGRIDVVAKRVTDLYPDPNRPGVQNYVFNAPRNDNDEQVDSRLDHRFRDRDVAFLRYSFHDRNRLESGALPPPASGGDTAVRLARAHAAVFSETHIFSGGNLVNEVRVGYTRNNGSIDVPTRERLWEQYGFKGLFNREDITGVPFFSPTGFSNVGDRSQAPDPRRIDVRQLVENLSWTKGRHSIRTGTNIRDFRRWSGITQFARGRFLFNGQFTAQQAGRGAGSSIADALLGLTNQAQLSTPLDITQHSRAYEVYIQDNFKVSAKLTLNLGFRYEFQPPFYERQNRAANFVYDRGLPDYGQIVPVRGDSIEARSFQKLDRNDFAPRVGLAWQVNQKTVVRAGYGIFYDANAQLPFGSQPSQNPPYYLEVVIPTANAQATSDIKVADGFPATALNPKILTGRSLASIWPFAFPDAMTNQWNLNVQRTLPGDSVFSMAYVGSNTAHRRLGGVDRNQPMPGPGANDPRRPFPNFSLVLSDVPMGANNYQALETKFERRFTRGFSTLLGYTWSHTMMGDIGQNTQVIAPEKMLSPEDLRQRFFSTAVWDLPLGQGRTWVNRGVLGTIVGGWQLAANFAAQTGLPQSPGVGTNTANTTGTIRPDRLRDGNLPRGERSPERWFDRTAFALPAAFQFGNSGAFIIEGPGLVNLDTTLSRQFVFGERWRLQFRTEFFNLLNEALFEAPNMLIDRPVGGAIATTVSPARQIQFALKLMW